MSVVTKYVVLDRNEGKLLVVQKPSEQSNQYLVFEIDPEGNPKSIIQTYRAAELIVEWQFPESVTYFEYASFCMIGFEARRIGDFGEPVFKIFRSLPARYDDMLHLFEFESGDPIQIEVDLEGEGFVVERYLQAAINNYKETVLGRGVKV